MIEPQFPPGWDAQRVQDLIDYYEGLSDEELTAKDEEAMRAQEGETAIVVPQELLPAIRELLARHRSA